MNSRRWQLPPLELLLAFEAAARQLSFTKAGEELFLTQSAVSRQIQALEESLGGKLFERRMRALAEVPTFTEAGLPGFEMRVTFAVLAPAGTPRAIIDKLSGEFGRIVALADIQEKLAAQGMIPFYSTPEQLGAILKADLAKYDKVIKSGNIQFDK